MKHRSSSSAARAAWRQRGARVATGVLLTAGVAVAAHGGDNGAPIALRLSHTMLQPVVPAPPLAQAGGAPAGADAADDDGGAVAELPAVQVFATALSRPSQAMTLAEAVRAAVAWYPAVKEAQGQLRQAGEVKSVAEAGYYPQISAGVSSDVSNQVLGGDDSKRLHTAGVSVAHTLYDFGKTDSEVQQAEAAIATARAQVLLSVDDVAKETAQAWLQLHHQQRMDEVARAQVEGVRKLAQLAHERQVMGASARSDAVQAHARLEAAQAQALSQQAQVQRWQFNLMNLTGSGAPRGIADEVPAQLAQACLGAGLPLGVPPAVQRAQAQRAEAEAQLKQADAQQYPSLAVEGAVRRGLDSASRRPGESALNSTVTLSFSAPLYQGGRNQARQRAAAHAVQAADAAVASAELEARKSLQEARAQHEGHAQREAVLSTRIGSMRETRDLYQQQYLQLGTRSLLDLLNAEQEYHGARTALLENEFEMQQQALTCLYQRAGLREFFALDGDALAAYPAGGQ